jgi:hypothetical protein
MTRLPQSTAAASFALAVVVAALAASCDSGGSKDTGSKDAKDVPTSSAKADGPTKKAGAKSADVSAEKMGTFTCKDVKDDACIGPTDRFKADISVVHVTYRTKDVPKNGKVYSIQWIAEDVGKAAKPNTVIATLEKKVVDVPDFGMKSYFVNSQLSKPTNGWPLGQYRVEIKLGDKLATTARFVIE